MPRRNTPRSLMRAKPPELLAAAAQRRPIAPADTLGFEEPAASRVGTTEDASNVDVPTLPSPPRTYLDEHRNNRVVVPFRKVRCAAAAAWVCIPGLTGCGMATGLDGYPRQVQSVRHGDTQGWTRRDRVETTKRFLGQRLWRPPCCRTRQGRIPTHSPRADAGTDVNVGGWCTVVGADGPMCLSVWRRGLHRRDVGELQGCQCPELPAVRVWQRAARGRHLPRRRRTGKACHLAQQRWF